MLKRKKLFFTILLMMINALDCSPQSEKSNAFFANGMEAYDKGDYKMAADWFSKAKELDEIELTGVETRRRYSTNWLAHCLFLLGDEAGAMQISPQDYNRKPVDRRLTVESDKEFELAYTYEYKEEYGLSLEHALKGLVLEEEELGISLFHCYSCLFVGNLYRKIQDADASLQYYTKGLESLQNLGFEDFTLEFLLLQGRISSYLDKGFVAFAVNDLYRMEEIANFEKDVKYNPYPEAVTKTVAVKIELHKRGNIDRIIEKAKDAFLCLLDLYNTNEDEAFFQMKDCIDCFYFVDRLKDAYDLMEDALPVMLAKNISTRHKGLWLTRMGILASDRESAEMHLEEGAKLLLEAKDIESYYTNLSYQASWWQEEQPDKAIELYLKVLDFEEKNNDSPFQRVPVLRNLGVLYEECGQIESALDCFRKAVALLEENRDEPLYILTYMQFITVMSKACPLGLISDETFSTSTVGQELSDLLQKSMNSNFLKKGIGIHEVYNTFIPFLGK